MPTADDARAVLREALRIAESCVVCEILDPHVEEGLWGRLRHMYYCRFLPDPGTNFVSSAGLNEILESVSPNAVVDRWDVSTINGVYGCAILSKN
jgi:hypothetical protein